MKNKIKSITIVFIFASVSALFVILMSYIFLQSDYFRKKAAGLISGEINKAINGRFTIEKLEGNLLTNVALNGVSIYTDEGKVLSADSLKAEYFLPALITRKILIKEVTLNGLKVLPQKSEDDSWNYQKLFEVKEAGSKSGSAGSVLIDSIYFDDINIIEASVLSEKESGMQITGINIRSSLKISNLMGNARYALKIGSANFSVSRPQVKNTLFSGSVIYDGRSIVLDGVKVKTGDSSAEFNGKIENVNAIPIFDLSASTKRFYFKDIKGILPGIRIEDTVSTEIKVKGPASSIEIEQEIKCGSLKMENSGKINLPDKEYLLKSRITGARPENIFPGLGILSRKKSPKGEINAEVEVSVKGTDFKTMNSKIELSIAESTLNGHKINSGIISVSLGDEKIDIKSGELQTSFGTVVLSGGGVIGGLLSPFGEINIGFATELKNLDLSALTGVNRIKSGINASAVLKIIKKASIISSAGNEILFKARAEISPSNLSGISLKDSVIDASLEKGVLKINECRIKSDELDISVSGEAALKGEMDFSYDLKIGDLKLLKNIVKELEFKGSVNSKGTIYGPFSKPAIDCVLNGTKLGYKMIEAGSLSAEIKAQKGEVYPHGSITLEASEIRSSNAKIKSLKLSADSKPGTIDYRVEIIRDAKSGITALGAISGAGTVKTGINIDSLIMYADTVTWRNVKPVHAEIANKEVYIRSFEIMDGSEKISIFGNAPAEGEVNLIAEMNSVTIENIFLLAGFNVPFNGKFSCLVKVTGKSAAPSVRGNVTLKDGNFGSFAFESITADMDYSSKILKIALEAVKGKQTILQVEGLVPIELSFADMKKNRLLKRGLDLSLTSAQLDLGLLMPFIKDIEKISGKSVLSLTLGGDPGKPAINGNISVENGRLKIFNMTPEYRDINCSVVFTNDTVRIDKIYIRSGNGTAEINGKIFLSGLELSGIDLQLECRNFLLLKNEMLSSVIDAGLKLNGPVDGSSLSGYAKILEGAVRIPEEIRKDVREIEILEEGSGEVLKIGEKRPLSFVENMRINTELILPGNTWIRGKGLVAEIEGKLLVRKEKLKTVFVSGNIRTVRGSFNFRGRRLNIDEGVAAFTGTSTDDANLAVRASCRVENVGITVIIGGTISKPEIVLQSNPPMDESDIVSYLIFGKSSVKLTESEDKVLQRTTTGVIGEIAARGLNDILGREFALDVVDIRPGEETGLGVGKYLTNKLFIKYEWYMGVEDSSRTILDYQINNRFSLHSQIGNEKTSGADILWTHSY